MTRAADDKVKSIYRMPINIVAIGGMIGGIVLLAIAIAATAADPLSFLNAPSAILVLGGTLAATIITYSFDELKKACQRFAGLLRREVHVGAREIELFAKIATLARGGKVKQIDDEIATVKSPFVRSGLQLLSDGMPIDAIVNVLEWRTRQQASVERNEAMVFRTMASYSPAFGMVGTLIGSINMLRLMGAGATPREIGMNLAFALITTLYGLVFANAFLKPIAAKIENRANDHLHLMGTITEAIRAIGEGHGPGYVREILAELITAHENEVGRNETLGPAS